MNRWNVLALALLGIVPIPETLGATKPNVLLITADDLGFALGCYGDRIAKTPHLDALAAQGIRFTRGYVTQASCSPSRASLLTGLYPHQHGQIGLANTGIPYGLREPFPPLLPDLMKQAGYRTAIFGKLHIRPEERFRFDLSATDAVATCQPGVGAAFLKKLIAQREKDQPFFLYANYFDPHDQAPAGTVPRDIEGLPKVKVNPQQVTPFPFIPEPHRSSKVVRQQLADYYCGVNRLDELMGELLAVLRESGLEKNTLILFLGDNGPQFYRGKCNPTEGGTRVPFLAVWPGVIAPKQTSDALISTIDILPTLAEVAGFDCPQGLPGVSLMPLFRGSRTKVRDLLATEFTSHTANYFAPARSIRDERYKVTINLLKSPDFLWPQGITMEQLVQAQPRADRFAAVELYDLDTDPWETTNLADKPELAEVRQRLLKELDQWRRATHDPLLEVKNLQALVRQHAQVTAMKKKR